MEDQMENFIKIMYRGKPYYYKREKIKMDGKTYDYAIMKQTQLFIEGWVDFETFNKIKNKLKEEGKLK